MNSRFLGVVLVLGTMLIFLAEAMVFHYDLAVAVGSAGAVALVAAEVVRRGLGRGDGGGFVPPTG
ncbi:hypothetical protein OG738_09710 [Amycolatopsis sp. NBC_01488]|uniref:hypothetical protein n=1 Tax=Amycolatopsis sp. NBC_01488 TaxID=2903563 RepID=UPI002E2C5854|nr:hypothetical protein [Amycolatopsis sp. NBC_01488]